MVRGGERAQRRDQLLAVGSRPRKGERDRDERTPSQRLRHLGERRVADQADGRGDGVRDAGDPLPIAVHDLARLLHGPQERAGERLAEGEQLDLDRRDDHGTAAAAAQRPEEVWLALGVDVQLVPDGGHDVERPHVAGREALAPREPAEPSTQQVARDADAGGEAVEGDEVMRSGRRDDITPTGAGLDLRRARLRVDRDAVQPCGAQQDRAGEVAEAGRSVAGALGRDAQAVGRGEAHRRGDVLGRGGEHDECRVLIGDEVPGLASSVPARIARGDEIAGDRGAEGVEVDRGMLVHHDVVADTRSDRAVDLRLPELATRVPHAP